MKIKLKNAMLIFLIVVFITIPTTVKASFYSDIIDMAGKFVNDGKNNAESSEEVTDAEMVENVTTLYYTLITLGSIVSVGYGGVLGIKFMTASAEDKAKVKESMIPFVVGMAVIFGSFLIWRIAIGVFSSM